MSIKRIWHRVQPLSQILKRKQRQREMADRERVRGFPDEGAAQAG